SGTDVQDGELRDLTPGREGDVLRTAAQAGEFDLPLHARQIAGDPLELSSLAFATDRKIGG
ncbi:MAG: hypothetical protein KDD60_12725, partial [Bdellovibrionales bacterium]|nr:hypothetical protein [Bdellovibrionales bacterium]